MKGLVLSLLLLVGGLASGCDSAGNGDLLGNNPPPAPPGQAQPNPTLTINLQSAGNGVNGLNDFEVIAYGVRGAELARQTVGLGQNASFADLPAGSVQIRVVGRNAAGAVLGFSDISTTIPSDTRVDAPALTPTDRLPPPATPGAPFLAFTGLPASYQAGVAYNLEVSAFDAQGQLDTTANSSVGLSSSGVSAMQPAIGVLLTNGRAVFPSIVFPQGSNGTVTFTASAGGFQSAVSPTLPVRSD